VSPEAALAVSEFEISSSGLLVVVTPDSRRGRGGSRGGSVCTGRLGAGVGLLVIPEGPATGEDPLGRLCCEREAGGRAKRRTSSQVSGFSMASRSIYKHNDVRVGVRIGVRIGVMIGVMVRVRVRVRVKVRVGLGLGSQLWLG